jgi:hypothetical protein
MPIARPLPKTLARLPHRAALLAGAADLFGQGLAHAAAASPAPRIRRDADDGPSRCAAIRAARTGATPFSPHAVARR